MKFLSRSWVVFIFSVSLAIFISGVVSYTKENKTQVFSLVSPLPQLFVTKGPEVLAAGTFWKPSENTLNNPAVTKPNLSAVAVVSYDLSNDTLLYSKNIHQRHPIASITKIMTAIVALETEKLDDTITISQSAATVGNDSMGLSEGEKLTLKDLLYGMILPSGNDAAEAIAQGNKYGRDNFVFLMNKKAEDLGLTDTHFTNPSGLEGDGNQYSTAYDLLVMTRYGLQNPAFEDVVSTVNYDIDATDGHKTYHLFNDTNLLTSYPGVKGVKTGFTDEAGMCLVSYLEYKGHKIIAVILDSDDRRGEMKELLDYSLEAEGVTPPPHS